MAAIHCSVCGEVLPDAEAKVAALSPDEAATCASCLKKLDSSAASGRTTVVHAPGSIKVVDGEVLEPEADTIQAGGGRSGSRSAGRQVRPSEPAELGAAPDGEAIGAGPGSRFGNYEIIGEISRGSFGVVYKARQPGLDRLVALKVLLAGAYASNEAIARFQREAKAVARLKHPSIVPVYDTGIFEGHHYFAMEFVEGQALSELVKNKSITTAQALAYTETLSDAIESAHKAGVIHRDIKPSNILVDQQGLPHITDFGLAKQVDLDTKYTVSGTTLGTPAYMPPEQARGEIERIDARSDVYSLGAVLYEMLTGQTPFMGRSLLEVVVSVINEPVKAPRQLNPRLNHDIQTIVMKCLEKDPAQRYQTAAALRDDVSRFRAGETICAKPASVIRLTGRLVKRHAPLFAAAVIVLLVVSWSAYLLHQKTKIIVEKTQTIKKQDEEKRKIETEEMNRKKADWRPVWWFPPKSFADMMREDIAKIYKAPPGKEDRELKDAGLEAVDDLPATAAQVSQEEFFGDLDMDFIFHLDECGLPNGLRMGLQSADKNYHGIPYLAEVRDGIMALRGPADLYSYTDPPPDRPKPSLKLKVKAEKEVPALASGLYTLSMRRHGIDLRVELNCPNPKWNCALEIRDANLSSWVFKRTQFVVRSPAGTGVRPVSGEVRARFGGEEEEAFKDFYTGEYDDAQKRLHVLAEGKDCFLQACAMDKLGLLQEILRSGEAPPFQLYNDALKALDSAAKAADQKLAPDELPNLRKELRVRKVLASAKEKRKTPDEKWAAFKKELLYAWKGEEKIGEPLAWDFQGVLEQLMNDAPLDTEVKMDVGLAIFQRLGLPPGGPRLGKAAGELAALLAANGRFAGLVALHTSYPSGVVCDAFFEAVAQAARNNNLAEALPLLKYIAPIAKGDSQLAKLNAVSGAVAATAIKLHKYAEAGVVFSLTRSFKLIEIICDQVDQQLKESGGEEFEQFRTVLLPDMLAAVLTDAAAGAKFTELIEKLARTQAAAGKPDDLCKLHATLRGAEAKSDPRLAGAFAGAISDLAKANDPAADTQALELLKYCGEHVAANDPKIKSAALLLAKNKAVLNERRDYGLILAIQQAYPAPELLELALGVMRQLNSRQCCEEAVLFYNQARLAFWSGGSELTVCLVDALNNLNDEDQRVRLLAAVKNTVQNGLEELKDEVAGRMWRLEYGDIELALDYWERARQTYQQLLSAPKAEPVLQSLAWLRLAVVDYLHPRSINPGAFLPQPPLDGANLSEEMKLALRLFGTQERLSIDELVVRRHALAAPLVLTDGEWNLLCGLRMLLDQNYFVALPLLQEAERQAGAGSVWVRAAAPELAQMDRFEGR